MSGTLASSKVNQYAALGVGTGAAGAASKAVQYAALGVGTGGTGAVSKALQYVVVTPSESYPLGTMRRQRERTFPRGFRKYPRFPWMLDWRLGR